METILSTSGLKMEERGDLIVIELDPEKAAGVVPPEPKKQPEKRNREEKNNRG